MITIAELSKDQIIREESLAMLNGIKNNDHRYVMDHYCKFMERLDVLDSARELISIHRYGGFDIYIQVVNEITIV